LERADLSLKVTNATVDDALPDLWARSSLEVAEIVEGIWIGSVGVQLAPMLANLVLQRSE